MQKPKANSSTKWPTAIKRAARYLKSKGGDHSQADTMALAKSIYKGTSGTKKAATKKSGGTKKAASKAATKGPKSLKAAMRGKNLGDRFNYGKYEYIVVMKGGGGKRACRVRVAK